MKTAKIFKCGNSQAVRLPKEFRFISDEVEISKQRDGSILLREKPKDLKHAFYLLTQLPDDFFSSPRDDNPPQEREFFE